MADIPEYLKEQTEEGIMQRMLDKVPADIDKTEGSYIWDALAPTALEHKQAAIWAQEVLERSFATTIVEKGMPSEYLDLRCAEHGVFRKDAVAAVGKVQFTGKPGANIPLGARIATPADDQTGTQSVFFTTTQAGTLDAKGQCSVPIVAEDGGKKTIVAAGTITVIAAPIPDVTGVVNLEATHDGYDPENDADLLARYLFKIRNPATSGNKNHYKQWATEVPGVGDAAVVPLKFGPGTVDIALIDYDRKPVGPAIIDAVIAHIADNAPIGATVTISAAKTVSIDLSVKLILKDGFSLEPTKLLLLSNYADYLKKLVFAQDNMVRYARIAQVVLDTSGVYDYSDLKINGNTNNIPIDNQSMAVPGTVTIT